MVRRCNIVGITGAPCTGKTTLAQALQHALAQAGQPAQLLREPARELAPLGVRIDAGMRAEDYEAFLRAYLRRDRQAEQLCIADRTPLDHYTYLAVNTAQANRAEQAPAQLEQFLRRHHGVALAAMRRYRLLCYLPPELELQDDAFRVTDPAYRAALDAALRRLLAESAVPCIEVRGAPEERLATVLAALNLAWPTAASGGAGA